MAVNPINKSPSPQTTPVDQSAASNSNQVKGQLLRPQDLFTGGPDASSSYIKVNPSEINPTQEPQTIDQTDMAKFKELLSSQSLGVALPASTASPEPSTAERQAAKATADEKLENFQNSALQNPTKLATDDFLQTAKNGSEAEIYYSLRNVAKCFEQQYPQSGGRQNMQTYLNGLIQQAKDSGTPAEKLPNPFDLTQTSNEDRLSGFLASANPTQAATDNFLQTAKGGDKADIEIAYSDVIKAYKSQYQSPDDRAKLGDYLQSISQKAVDAGLPTTSLPNYHVDITDDNAMRSLVADELNRGAALADKVPSFPLSGGDELKPVGAANRNALQGSGQQTPDEK